NESNSRCCKPKWKGDLRRFFLAQFLLTGLALFCATEVLNAATVSVTAATGGGAIFADTANGAFTKLKGPIPTESAKGAISTGTIVFNVPAGFEWDTGGTAPTVTITSSGGGTSMAISLTSRTTSAITFNVTQQSAGSNNGCTNTFGNFRVRPTIGNP